MLSSFGVVVFSVSCDFASDYVLLLKVVHVETNSKPAFLEMLANAGAMNSSSLCVGFDPDPKKFPQHLSKDANGALELCMSIAGATYDKVIAFKPQIAYFAALRAEKQLEQLITYLRTLAPNVPIILDAKRGDIGSTAEQYAIEAFERYGADAVTLSPFMGFDTIEPYLKYHGKGAFLLCRTSNPGGDDFQNRILADVEGNPKQFEHIAALVTNKWNTNGQLGLVVGATYPEELAQVRKIAPNLPLLIPGIGAQGGDILATVNAAWRPDAPIVVNSSRAILYASSGIDFAEAAGRVAEETRCSLEDAKVNFLKSISPSV